MSLVFGAPRLHSGLKPDEFPAILQKGEEVRSKEDVKRGKRGSGIVGGTSDESKPSNTIIIQAVDARSFADLCRRNPEAVFGPILQQLEDNAGRTRMSKALGR
jgi:uncharacterized protein YcsI (UPF0317 family)